MYIRENSLFYKIHIECIKGKEKCMKKYIDFMHKNIKLTGFVIDMY